MKLIFYHKPGCHLCETLAEKLTQLPNLSLELEMRDINTRADWFEAYEYEIPVLAQVVEGEEVVLPRLSPRLPIQQMERMLKKTLRM
ncbi:glutaredoxin family protein [Spirulina subsalsa FACHB-351]|uniref:Glutaredoxin family protein n=1 Tax=Spirulina subsalsa FACHB-351 TaxID=234711 RepID=A0ABT3L3Y8_9CYAN|nr:glutaredoxin family protein [Spirulina subsalsa]MCW6036218.1 glutaredoxin family protein [Spirulina subsalsa FACHB-351]